MNPAKTHGKIGAINELGVKYDDMRAAVERDVYRKEGYQLALNEIQQSTLKSIFERVDAERDAGRFDIPTASLIKEYLARVHAAVDNLKLMNERHRTLAEGRALGLRDAIGLAKKTLDAEKAKLAALEAQVAAGHVTAEASGTTPIDVRPDVQNSALEDLNRRRAEARERRHGAATVAALEPAPAPKRGRPRGRNRPTEAGA